MPKSMRTVWGALLLPAMALSQPFPEIVARTSGGVQADQIAARGRMSPDARYVAFATASGALDPTDGNGLIDVYVKDRATGVIVRASKGPGGVSASGGHSGWDGFGPDTHGIAISDDGRYVAFLSSATNLVANDLNARRDAFLWDRTSGNVVLLSKSAGGIQADADSTHIAISGDGSLVAFSSFATNLVAGDSNSTIDLFGYVVGPGTIERLSLTDADTQMPSAPSADRGALEPSISRDGRYVAFTAEPALGTTDCAGQAAETWVRDRVAQTTVQASRFTGEAGTVCGGTVNPRISAGGRYVVWYSPARMALPDVAGGTLDIFLRDMQLGVTEHISQDTDGQVGHSGCGWPWVSEDGRFVSFHCGAQFGPDDLNFSNDTYLRDRELKQTLRFSVSSTQQHPNSASEFASISPDGQWLLFESQATNLIPGDANGHRDLLVTPNPFLFDPSSQIGGGGIQPSTDGKLSDDGRFLFFRTTESLVAGDNNGMEDVYRRDLRDGGVIRVSVGDDEGEIPAGSGEYSVSAAGDVAVFTALDDGSIALRNEPRARRKTVPPTVVGFIRHLITGTTQRIGPPALPATQPVLSGDGSTVVFVTGSNAMAGDTNGMDDVYVADTNSGALLSRASAPGAGDSDGPSSAPSISHDGSVVVFASEASNIAGGAPDTNGLRDVLMVNLSLAQRVRVSAPPGGGANGASGEPAVSGDGRFVVFSSQADNLGGTDANGMSDVFLVDTMGQGAPELVSLAGAGSGNGNSGAPTISADGETIAFASDASNLVGGDGNAQADVFVHDRPSRLKRRVARSDGGTQGNGASQRPRLNRNGQRVTFSSAASNLSLRDVNGAQPDVFFNGPPNPFRVFRGRFE